MTVKSSVRITVFSASTAKHRAVGLVRSLISFSSPVSKIPRMALIRDAHSVKLLWLHGPSKEGDRRAICEPSQVCGQLGGKRYPPLSSGKPRRMKADRLHSDNDLFKVFNGLPVVGQTNF